MAKKGIADATNAMTATIAPLEINFYREDMNSLVAKLNEVIEAVNNQT